MESLSSFFEPQSSLKNNCEISPIVENHLKKVYLALFCTLVASAAGVYLHILFNIGGYLPTLELCTFMIVLLSHRPQQEKQRVSLLMAIATYIGALSGPQISSAIQVIDPRILVSALVRYAVAFVFFSVLAMRVDLLYLGGLLSSKVFRTRWLYYAFCIFGILVTIFKFDSYFGFFVFVGNIVVDTQVIIEAARLGDFDYVKHALTLFTNFGPGLFRRVHIFHMMWNNALKDLLEKKKREEKRLKRDV